MPRKTFLPQQLTASEVNTYLMDQSVMVFDSATARSAALTTPTEGMVTYLKDVDQLAYYDGSNWVPYIVGSGLRNVLINGDFRVWQRNSSFTAPANLAMTADRWYCVFPSAQRFASRFAGFSGSQFCMRVGRAAASTSADTTGIAQVVESTNCYPLQGQRVVLSFDARKGANYSEANSTLMCSLDSGTAVDQGRSAWWSPGWTGYNNIFLQQVTLSTTAQRFYLYGTVPATAQEINVYFGYMSAGTAGANDYFEITNVQLETIRPTPFEQRPISVELSLCERYYEKTYGYTTVPGTASNDGNFLFGTSTWNDGNIYNVHRFRSQKRNALYTATMYSTNGTINQSAYYRGSATLVHAAATVDLRSTVSFRSYVSTGTAWATALLEGHYVIDNEL